MGNGQWFDVAQVCRGAAAHVEAAHGRRIARESHSALLVRGARSQDYVGHTKQFQKRFIGTKNVTILLSLVLLCFFWSSDCWGIEGDIGRVHLWIRDEACKVLLRIPMSRVFNLFSVPIHSNIPRCLAGLVVQADTNHDDTIDQNSVWQDSQISR